MRRVLDRTSVLSLRFSDLHDDQTAVRPREDI